MMWLLVVGEKYKDRLVPARDISFVQEKLYQNQLLVQEHLSATAADVHSRAAHRIGRHGAEVDSLVDKFAHTFLVNQMNELVSSKHVLIIS